MHKIKTSKFPFTLLLLSLFGVLHAKDQPAKIVVAPGAEVQAPPHVGVVPPSPKGSQVQHQKNAAMTTAAALQSRAPPGELSAQAKLADAVQEAVVGHQQDLQEQQLKSTAKTAAAQAQLNHLRNQEIKEAQQELSDAKKEHEEKRHELTMERLKDRHSNDLDRKELIQQKESDRGNLDVMRDEVEELKRADAKLHNVEDEEKVLIAEKKKQKEEDVERAKNDEAKHVKDGILKIEAKKIQHHEGF